MPESQEREPRAPDLSADDWRRELVARLTAGPFGRLRLLLTYGSASPGGDLDYFAVYDCPPLTDCVMLGGVDLWAADEAAVLRHASLLDPFVTEPFLTGRMLHGDSQLAADVLRAIRCASPSSSSILYLLGRSFEAFHRASEIAARDDTSAAAARLYWSALSFSVSYWAFARQYRAAWDHPLTLSELAEAMPDAVHQVWSRIADSKRTSAPIETALAVEWADLVMGVRTA